MAILQKIRKHNITGEWEYYDSVNKKWATSVKLSNEELFKYYARTTQNYLLSYENDAYPEYTHEIQKTLYEYDISNQVTELLPAEQTEDNIITIPTTDETDKIKVEALEISSLDIIEDKATSKTLLIVRFNGGTRPYNFTWKLHNKVLSDALNIHYIKIERPGNYSVIINDTNGLSVNSSKLIKPEDIENAERSSIITSSDEDKLKIDIYK